MSLAYAPGPLSLDYLFPWIIYALGWCVYIRIRTIIMYVHFIKTVTRTYVLGSLDIYIYKYVNMQILTRNFALGWCVYIRIRTFNFVLGLKCIYIIFTHLPGPMSEWEACGWICRLWNSTRVEHCWNLRCHFNRSYKYIMNVNKFSWR